MASPGKKKKNFSILEEIYHDKNDKKQSKQSIKEYWQDPKRIDKLLSGAVLFFGLAAIVLGFFQFKYNIGKYFLPKKTQVDFEQQQQADLLGLRQKDTDQDGLSDYDEFYIYNSSPYLKDTDSDGIDDPTEVARGSDPTCPKGENCLSTLSDLSSNPATADDLLLNSQLSIPQLRQLLIQAGMTPEELVQFSDEELLAIYQEVVSQGQLESVQPAQTIALPTSNIEDLTPIQLRQLLSQAGISNEILDSVTDEELMQLVAEILGSN